MVVNDSRSTFQITKISISIFYSVTFIEHDSSHTPMAAINMMYPISIRC